MALEILIPVDVNKKPNEQPVPLHNRWHPDVPAVKKVEPGAEFRIECLDWTGGQIKNNDSANDVRDVDLNQVHYLSGPVAVENAQPGDLLVVDILDIGPLESSPWGFTGIFSKENGGGFLTDYYPKACKAIWDFEGPYATSRHINDIRFAGLTHPGLMGTAPSHELLKRWNKREQALIDTNPHRIPPLALPPQPKEALAGLMKDTEKYGREAARTVAPRENGGNCDIKNLTRGSRAYFPVYVEGGNLSMGDIHFSQGDGEVSFCGGIEMAGRIDLKVDLIKNGMATYGITSPVFETNPIAIPHYEKHIVFEGISVDDEDKQYYLDPYISYRRSILNAIEYLKKFGYTGEQAYIILSTAPVEGRISGIVDIPNSCTTVYVPSEIFNFDILPSTNGPTKKNRGDVARTS